MNLIKHMEAVFIAATLLTAAGAYLSESLPHAHAAQVKVSAADAPATITPTVVIQARRMTAQEKQSRSAHAQG